jgi:DNA-directed RNA polymerase subunit H (RpoH/RPB5)
MEARAKETIRTMLVESGLQGDFEDVQAPLDETRMFLFSGVLVVFSDKTRVTERELNKILEYADTNDYKSGVIIVTPTTPSELVINSVRDYIANPKTPLLQIFELRHLGFDISKHRLVPKHRILKEGDLNAFLKQYGLTPQTTHLLPKLDCQDPMAKRIRARPGDVVEITGLSLSSGEYRRARLCVSRTT